MLIISSNRTESSAVSDKFRERKKVPVAKFGA